MLCLLRSVGFIEWATAWPWCLIVLVFTCELALALTWRLTQRADAGAGWGFWAGAVRWRGGQPLLDHFAGQHLCSRAGALIKRLDCSWAVDRSGGRRSFKVGSDGHSEARKKKRSMLVECPCILTSLRGACGLRAVVCSHGLPRFSFGWKTQLSFRWQLVKA